jgi:hypothetical protein
VSDAPLVKPDHLRDIPMSRGAWLSKHAVSVAALVLGIVSFTTVAMLQHPFWATPDWRVSVPGFAVTAAASIGALVRREGAPWLWIVGLGFAAAALVLGWFLMLAIVIGATAVLMLILHTVM